MAMAAEMDDAAAGAWGDDDDLMLDVCAVECWLAAGDRG